MFSNTPVYVFIYNLLQVGSVSLGNAVLCLLSLITLIGLLGINKKLVGFHNNLVAMATVNLAMGITGLAIFPLQTFDATGGDAVYQFAKFYPDLLAIILIELCQFLNRYIFVLIGLSMIYRTSLVIRPRWSTPVGWLLGILSLPYPLFQTFHAKLSLDLAPSCNLMCWENNYTSPTITKVVDTTEAEFLTKLLDYIAFFTVLFLGIPCIMILHRWFKKGAYSAKTMAMQRRLTGAMAAMIIGHVASLIPRVVYTIGLYLEAEDIISGILPYAVTVAFCSQNCIAPINAMIIYVTCKNALKFPSWLAKISSKIRATSTRKKITVRTGTSYS